VRYRVAVTELIATPKGVDDASCLSGESIFQTVVDFKPNLAKLVAALTPPRIRKPRSQKA